jgi:hypothetical protein
MTPESESLPLSLDLAVGHSVTLRPESSERSQQSARLVRRDAVASVRDTPSYWRLVARPYRPEKDVPLLYKRSAA